MYKRKEVLQEIIKNHPDAVLVKNKYKALGHMADIMYPQLNGINKKVITDIVYDIVNGDRDWRKLTEGMDKENKVRLEQEYVLKNYA